MHYECLSFSIVSISSNCFIILACCCCWGGRGGCQGGNGVGRVEGPLLVLGALEGGGAQDGIWATLYFPLLGGGRLRGGMGVVGVGQGMGEMGMDGGGMGRDGKVSLSSVPSVIHSGSPRR